MAADSNKGVNAPASDDLLEELSNKVASAANLVASLNDQVDRATAYLNDIAQVAKKAESAQQGVLQGCSSFEVAAKEAFSTTEQSVETAVGESQRSESARHEVEGVLDDIAKSALSVKLHSGKLKKLEEQVESLLPGATSAGLAKAFKDQRERFVSTKIISITAFVASIFVLIGVAAFSSGDIDDGTLLEVLLFILKRLPIVGPCVWLAVFAGKRYVEAVRVEEDYAYKEAISTAFEGYKKQMAEVKDEEPDGSPLVTLCNNQLAALAEPPGRLYAKYDADESVDKAPAMASHAMSKAIEKFHSLDPDLQKQLAKLLQG